MSKVIRQNVRARRSPISFDANSITGLKLWLSADSGAYTDAGVTLATNGQSVRQWNDRSPNGNNILQTTAGARPLFASNILAGSPVIRFDGTDDSMVVTFGGLLAQPNTIIFVFSITSGSIQKQFFDGANPSYIDRNGIYGESSGKLAFIAGGTAPEFGSPLTVPTPFRIYTAVFNNASSELFLNGTSLGTGNPGSDAAGGLRLGANSADLGNMAVDVSEFLIYNSLLSTNDRMSVENYLNSKYNIY